MAGADAVPERALGSLSLGARAQTSMGAAWAREIEAAEMEAETAQAAGGAEVAARAEADAHAAGVDQPRVHPPAREPELVPVRALRSLPDHSPPASAHSCTSVH